MPIKNGNRITAYEIAVTIGINAFAYWGALYVKWWPFCSLKIAPKNKLIIKEPLKILNCFLKKQKNHATFKEDFVKLYYLWQNDGAGLATIGLAGAGVV